MPKLLLTVLGTNDVRIPERVLVPVSKVSIVGAGMVSTPGVTYRMFRALSNEKINILAISTSEIKLSVIIDENNTLNAIKKLHTIFDLD